MCRAHFQKGEQETQAGFGALVFVNSIRMQAIAATAGFRIIEWQSELILIEVPIKDPPGVVRPQVVSGGALRFEAGCNHCASFHRLLIEHCFSIASHVKPIRSDGRKVSFDRTLFRHKKGQGTKTCRDHFLVFQPRSGYQKRLWQARVAIRQPILKPWKVGPLGALKKSQKPLRKQLQN